MSAQLDALRPVAGLVWGVVAGHAITDDDERLLRAGLGGVVLFARNVRSPAQLRELTTAIRAAARGPVVIAIDQEGGHIIRIGEPLTTLPSPMAIGATGDAGLAHQVAMASGAELAACGIDVALAPVLDVATERHATVVGARSYGADPHLVGRFGAAAVRGYLEGGVLPMAKHFPGHGRTSVDSHLALPLVAGSAGDLDADLMPFTAAVAAGVPALMTAHVIRGDVDPRRPASLSPVTTRLARRRLGFDGLLVTDAIVMDAVARTRPLVEAASAAIRAGTDVVMALDPARAVIERLAWEARAERIPQARLVEASRRAAAFAARAAAVRNGRRRLPIGAGAHAATADEVARRALTLVEDRNGLPLRGHARLAVLDLASLRLSPVEDDAGSGATTGLHLAAAFGGVHVPLDAADPRSTALAAAAATPAERLIVLSRDAFADSRSAALVALLAGPRTVHVALRNPVDLELAQSGVRIAAYHEGPAAARALAAALAAGPDAFPGRLPIPLDPPARSHLEGELAS